MNLKRTVFAGISAAALILAATSVSADGIDQHISVGIGNGLDAFGDYNAVAVAALQQNSVQIVTSSIDVVIDGNYDASMSFGKNAFRNQILSNNNFNSGVNSVQGNAMAVSTTSNGGGGVPGLGGGL